MASRSETWLCSQLVELRPMEFSSARRAAHPGNLEEISTAGMPVAVEFPYSVGARVEVFGLPEAVEVTVVDVEVREGDFVMIAEFAAACEWSPDRWLPEHVLAMRPKAKKARR